MPRRPDSPKAAAHTTPPSPAPLRPSDTVDRIVKIDADTRKGLAKLGIITLEDLLRHVPVRYGDLATITTIDRLVAGQQATIYGRIKRITTKKSYRGGMPMAEGSIADESGTLSVVWFNQPYMAKLIPADTLVRVEGTVTVRNKRASMTNPHIEAVQTVPMGVGDSLFSSEEHGRLFPVYPETKGITSNWLYHTIDRVLKAGIHELVQDPIPDDILKKYNLPTLATACVWIHTPRKEADALAARKRFAFEEIFIIQTRRQMQRAELREKTSYRLAPSPEQLKQFVDRFPFPLTNAQSQAVDAILHDLASGHPMSRLLEGDVGSGKTAVAACAVYAATISRPDITKDYGVVQSAYMAPTEILATQLFENFIRYFEHTGISIGLMTGSGCRKFPSKVNPKETTPISAAQLKKWVANGDIAIVVGTHALIQKSVEFRNLGLVVIDEQHRFGTLQRKKLAQKNGFAPHLLSMTATPIPRTLALTLYGDLDLTLLDQMPAGRKTVITKIIRPHERKGMYESVKKELKAGRQAYVICPRIDEPDPDETAKKSAVSVGAEVKRLSNEIFNEYEVAAMHGKLTPATKASTMTAFEDGDIDILVSTSVIEVGVNVPNATSILIEGAERFGLAQLHQLRGRVLRSSHQGYCYIMTDSSTEKTIARLSALTTAKDGFELAEQDLLLRGAGELAGGKQWGITDLGMEAIRNIKMVEAARAEATSLIAADSQLSRLPILKAAAEARGEIHFE